MKEFLTGNFVLVFIGCGLFVTCLILMFRLGMRRGAYLTQLEAYSTLRALNVLGLPASGRYTMLLVKSAMHTRLREVWKDERRSIMRSMEW